MKHLLRTRALRRRVALTLAATLALPAALPVGTASAGHYSNTEELSAEDNVGAAIAYSASTFPETAEEVVLGRDDTFPDSLASGMLQATRPLLLTAGDALSEPTKAELERLGATTVHVLGGEQAIQPAVVEALEAEDYTVVRHSGPTRIDTAVEVAKALGASATKAIVARAFGDEEDESRGFADSLAAGGWAAAEAMPVLLTETEKLSDATSAYLSDSQITEVFVVGGQAAVGAVAVTQLEALGLTVKRVSGPTRFHTALAIAAERGFATAADAEKVILTEGQAPDAWAAGFAAAARSAKDSAPIVLAVGAEVPEPTVQFLNGGEEPSEDPEAQDPVAGLLCAPKLASEACDSAATALGQIEGAGGELLVVDVTSVGRYDHAVGTLTEPKAVNDFRVTGCGYTNEPVFFEPADGTFYLMLAGDPGTCSAEFALTLSSGVVKQTVEFTVGEDFTPPSALPIPELVVVRPVKQDEEGVHLRFVFDEPIAPQPEIDSSKFHLFDFEGKPDNDASKSLPSSVRQDPRNVRAVLAVFSSAQYENSTVAVARGGLVCAASSSANQVTDCDAATGGFATSAPSAVNGDEIAPGAVRDIDKLPNPTGHFGIRTLDKTSGNSPKPDLISVGDFQASDQSLLFTFSEKVKVPSPTAVGDATVLLKDGTIKKGDANGWSRGPTEDSLRVTFSGDGLTSADMEQIRRGFVSENIVSELAGANRNTPVAVVIAGGGISDRPDFVNIENVQTQSTSQKVTYVFEEPLDDFSKQLGPTSPYRAVMSDGTVAYPARCKTANAGGTDCATLQDAPTLSADKKEVTVTFTPPTANCDGANATKGGCLGGGLDKQPILYHTVLTDAVRSFASQQRNFADTIRVATPIIYTPGETLAPDLTSVRVRHTPEDCSVGELEFTPEKIEVRLSFDQTIFQVAGGSTLPTFWLWYPDQTDGATKGRARVVEVTPSAAITADVKELVYESEDLPPQAPGGGTCQNQGSWRGKYEHAKYLAIDGGKVAAGSTAAANAQQNYAAGMAVPN